MMKGTAGFLPGRGYQRGSAILFWVLSAVPIIFLVGTLAVDMAYIKYNQQRLNTLVEAATLAAAQDLWSETQATVKSTLGTYAAQWSTAATCTSPSVSVGGSSGGGGGAGNPNVLSANVTVRGPCVTFKNLTSVALPAASAASVANAITVTQRASVPLFFFPRWFGPIEIQATATASAGGGGAPPLNVMLVVDTTASMGTQDTNCPRVNGSYQTRLQCALSGARTLVHQLLARGNYTGLIIYPPLDSATAVSHQICGSVASGDIQMYMAGDLCNPWQDNATSKSTIIPLTSSSDYAQDGQLKSTHDLTKALGGVSGCGLESRGGVGTYFAQAVRQARYLLLQQSAVNSQKNVMIILTDGDAVSEDFPTTTTTTITGTINGSTASQSGRKMTVTAMASSCFKLAIGQSLSGSGITSGTSIIDMKPGTGCPNSTTPCTGEGSLGTYEVSKSLKLTSRTITVSSPTSPFESNQCQQAIVAANQAKDDDVLVYVIAYGASTSSGCSTDTSSTLVPLVGGEDVKPCKTLQWMAGDAASNSYPIASSPYFFSTSSSCSSVNGYSDLETTFGLIGSGLLGSRLIPDDAD
jgi:hypothetical protein